MKKLFHRKNICLLLLVTAAYLVPYCAFASEAGESGHAGSHDAGLMSLKFYFINFAIYFTAIFILAKKNLPGAWASRRVSLEQTINSSKSKIKQIEKSYNDAKAKLSKADTEVAEIKKSLLEETRREIEDVKISAQSAIQRIEKQVKDTLSAEQRSLENAMRKIYTEAALKLAEEKLKAQINKDSDKPLRDKTLNNMKELIH